MADSVNTQALTLLPMDSSSVSAGKTGFNAAKNPDSDAFSQVLDEQRGSEPSSAQGAGYASTAAKAGGKNLPAERSATAAADPSGDEQGTNAPAISDAGQGDSARAAQALGDPGDAASRQGSPSAGQGAAALTIVPAGSTPLDLLATKGTVTPSSASAAAVGLSVGEMSAGAAPVTEVAALSSLSAGQAAVAATLGESELPSASTGAAEPGMQDAAPGVVTAGERAVAATAKAAAGSVAVTSAANTAVDPEVALAAHDSSADDLARSSALGVDADGRIAKLQNDASVLTRSRVDWLRSGIGTETSTSSLSADAQIEALAELPRSNVQLRGDSAPPSAPTPLASAIGGVPPGSSSAVSPTFASGPGGLSEYALSHAPQDPEFPGELSARMKTLLRDGVREARLQLHPAELGRLQVTVSTDGDQARVSFVADTQAARDAIEQSMPRLREMLEQNGMQLAQSDVGQRDLQSGREGSDAESSQQAGEEVATGESEPVGILAAQTVTSRIDTYI
jgi:flagellar hook-length control protein FliK